MRDNRSQFQIGSCLHHLGHAVSRLFTESLQPLGITRAQARALGHIYAMEERNQLLCQKNLAEAMRITDASITSLIQGLEKKGLLKRKSMEQDARTKCLVITEEGKSIVHQCHKIFASVEQNLEETLSKEERETLLSLLKKMHEGLKSNM